MVTEKKETSKTAPAAKPVEKEAGKEAEASKDPKAAAKPVDEDEDLSEEDKQLKDELLLCVERLKEPNQGLYKQALDILRTRIRESTSSMTSVPKPLKFLRNHYEPLKAVYEKISDKQTKEYCADILSVLGMTISERRECLKYRYLSSKESVGSWGHEYARHLTAELTQEWSDLDTAATAARPASPASTQDIELTLEPAVVITRDELLELAKEIVAFYMAHNAEADACDLLMEIEHVELLMDFVEKETYQRVCLYLLGCVA